MTRTLAAVALALLPLAAHARAAHASDPAAKGNGPEADYPVVVGDPFTVDGKTYVPRDVLNYDAVGYAQPGEGGSAIVGAHRTLPLPSYIEVTSLASGRTILLRVTLRGPMSGAGLIALSPGAWAQLGLDAAAKAPVRVRRVNPPEPERALLRLGQPAPERMATPAGLLGVLKRKLGDASDSVFSESPRGAAANSLVAASPLAPALPDKLAESPSPAAPASAKPAPTAPLPPAKPIKQAAAPKAPAAKPAPTAAPAVATTAIAVQVGAFASADHAKAVAAGLAAQVTRAGKVWRVRLGPFADRAAAERALAKAHGAGYGDARIVREP